MHFELKIKGYFAYIEDLKSILQLQSTARLKG